MKSTTSQAEKFVMQKFNLQLSEIRTLESAVLGVVGFVLGIAVARAFSDGTETSTSFSSVSEFRLWVVLIGFQTAYRGIIVPSLYRWRANCHAITRASEDSRRCLDSSDSCPSQ
jgi:hypothetical protein